MRNVQSVRVLNWLLESRRKTPPFGKGRLGGIKKLLIPPEFSFHALKFTLGAILIKKESPFFKGGFYLIKKY